MYISRTTPAIVLELSPKRVLQAFLVRQGPLARSLDASLIAAKSKLGAPACSQRRTHVQHMASCTWRGAHGFPNSMHVCTNIHFASGKLLPCPLVGYQARLFLPKGYLLQPGQECRTGPLPPESLCRKTAGYWVR